ncbi:MAG TPA: response regulator [Chloroflexota bacterium]|nr:response regulator [Chloroflexota bacterium]
MNEATVLVVDDDPGIQEMVAAVLEMEGYRVCTAVGAATLPLAASEHPSLILLDVSMPGMDGVEVSRRLFADPTTAAIPIVAMTALREDAIQRGMRARDWLRKPFDIDDLVRMVRRWSTDQPSPTGAN